MKKPALVPPSPQAAREVRRNTPIRQARTCYRHLAGIAGVHLLDEMVKRGWLGLEMGRQPIRPLYHLTPRGTRVLAKRGVEIPLAHKSGRVLAHGCLDWTERRPHLGGELGAAIRHGLEAAGVIRRARASRVVTVITPVLGWLDEPPRTSS